MPKIIPIILLQLCKFVLGNRMPEWIFKINMTLRKAMVNSLWDWNQRQFG